MDSLLANYASSDEESEGQPPAKPDKFDDSKDEDFLPNSSSKRAGIFKSLPPPMISSLFNSLPAPKSQSSLNPKPDGELDRRAEVQEHDGTSKPKSSSSSSLFSSLPRPKSSASSSTVKKVVQFRPPTMMNTYASRVDDDEDDGDEEERQKKRSKASLSTASASSFLSSIPAPKHSATLGGGSGMGRRSMLETDTPASTTSIVSDEVVNTDDGYMKAQSAEMVYDYSSHGYYSGYGAVPDGNVGANSNIENLGNQSQKVYDQSNGLSDESYLHYGAYGVSSSDANMNSSVGSYDFVDYTYGSEQTVGYTNYDGGYSDYGSNAQYEHNWGNATTLPEASQAAENILQVAGKRGRKDVPPQIVEVKQDELMKNRPREDQVKLTGIAFGPAYQPTSTKGKPTKLHKRKHQIGSLYFDMRQKETELAERRAQGFLTKAQTQAKYGW